MEIQLKYQSHNWGIIKLVLQFQDILNSIDANQHILFLKNPIQELKSQPRVYELCLVIGIRKKLRKSISAVIKNFLATDLIIWIASDDTLGQSFTYCLQD